MCYASHQANIKVHPAWLLQKIQPKVNENTLGPTFRRNITIPIDAKVH